MFRSSSCCIQPGLRQRRLVLFALPLLLGLAASGPLQAQSSPEQSTREDHGGRHHRGMFRSGSPEGPPAPAVMRDSIKVTGKELQQYTQRYDSHMAATKPGRDSLRTTMQAVRAAFEKGDRSEARSRRDAVEKQWKQLADQDKKFEDGLKNILTKDQQTRYQQWKDRRKQEVHEQWRQQRTAGRRGGGIHHDSSGSRGQPSDSAKGLTK